MDQEFGGDKYPFKVTGEVPEVPDRIVEGIKDKNKTIYKGDINRSKNSDCYEHYYKYY